MNTQWGIVTIVGVAIIVTAAGSPSGHTQQEKLRKDNGRVLLIAEIDSKLSEAGDTITSELARRLVAGGASVTQLSELKEKDRMKIRGALGAITEKDRKILKSFSFTSIIKAQFSTNTLAPFNGLYISEARGTLKATDTENGKTTALANVATVRGFGNSQVQANRTALDSLAKEIPQDFIDQVVKPTLN
jgi:hypothetical protein